MTLIEIGMIWVDPTKVASLYVTPKDASPGKYDVVVIVADGIEIPCGIHCMYEDAHIRMNEFASQINNAL